MYLIDLLSILFRRFPSDEPINALNIFVLSEIAFHERIKAMTSK
ncbi:MAG: hypothetical protein KatS3mg083_085 [Candidatus Dojkabacteria bacterium]|nr:MAG: hypothetical protein KatS3mg083_085 [Candidatus Dojkabacteria bacterium]